MTTDNPTKTAVSSGGKGNMIYREQQEADEDAKVLTAAIHALYKKRGFFWVCSSLVWIMAEMCDSENEDKGHEG